MKSREDIRTVIGNLTEALSGGEQMGMASSPESMMIWCMREALRWSIGDPSQFADLVKSLSEVE